VTTKLQKATQSAATYDEMFREGGWDKVFALPYRHSPYYPMFKRVYRELRRINSHSVLEVGCGTGAFAHMLIEHDWVRYRGFDFSGEAVRQAQERTGRSTMFTQSDADDDKSYQPYHDYDTLVCTEVLEHLPDDLGVIARWPKDKKFIATVPNYDSRYHERFFDSGDAVRRRYSELLKVDSLRIVKKPYLSDLGPRNLLRELRWNRYRPKVLAKILGFGSAREVGCWFVFSGTIRG